MFRCTNAFCSTADSFQNFNLGTLPCPGRICPPATLRIVWEPALNRFRFLRAPVPGVPNVAEQIATYTFADTNLAGLPFRALSVAPLPATCTAAAGRKTAFMDALFDNVLANVVNVGTNAASGFDAVDLGEALGPGEVPVP
ncbi:MAG: hypothetical protein HOP18_25590 [Deltaproteobacteria bacterium]|nr:hypothetical protein [Deltaproteobacteria bacterium]